MKYWCNTCKKEIRQSLCLECNNNAEPIADTTTEDESESPSDHQQQDHSESRYETNGTSAIGYYGEDELEQFIKQGQDIYAVAGINTSGKTQLINAISIVEKQGIDAEQRPGGIVIRTSEFSINITNFPTHLNGGRPAKFFDISGENFLKIYGNVKGKTLAEQQTVSQRPLRLLYKIVDNLAGIILVIDLKKQWGTKIEDNWENNLQIDIAVWLLNVFRWLKYGKRKNIKHLINKSEGLTRKELNYAVQDLKIKKRLHCPVLVLFSKADALDGVTIKKNDQSIRPIFPRKDSPFFVAKHCFDNPNLMEALITNVKYFHIDFCHAVVPDPHTGWIVGHTTPCGISLAIRWLCHKQWRRRWYNPVSWGNVSTQRLIKIQEFIDKNFLHQNARWHSLLSRKKNR
ncbi:hypothetical protein TI05_01610 [Achromatium sp. WMS3]|nr:hypothetical protein TI05_01610 [Achromatium sp. WMS3]